MSPPDRKTLARLMAAMASGDHAALFPFLEEFGAELTSFVRRIVAGLHRHDVLRSSEDIEYLVQSAAFVMFDRAGSWNPDGALPWIWAERAISAEIVSWLGHPATEWDSNHHVVEAEPPVMHTPDLVDLASEHVELHKLMGALDEVASKRDAKVHLEYQVQKALGDQSPANTVGDLFDLSPPNVRQIDRRVRKRLSAIRHTDERLAPLARLSWVEAC